jgi:hypothetical protein
LLESQARGQSLAPKALKALTWHPAAEWLPMMSEPELQELAADIKTNGQREPIMRDRHGVGLDGRNRLAACKIAGVAPRFETWLGDPADAVGYIISCNLHRRHLDASQRAMIAARLATMRQGERTDLAPNGATSQTDAAERLDVGRRTVQRAATVLNEGVPELVAAVEQGKVPVSAAATIAEQPPERQKEILAVSPQEQRAAVRALRTEPVAGGSTEVALRTLPGGGRAVRYNPVVQQVEQERVKEILASQTVPQTGAATGANEVPPRRPWTPFNNDETPEEEAAKVRQEVVDSLHRVLDDAVDGLSMVPTFLLEAFEKECWSHERIFRSGMGRQEPQSFYDFVHRGCPNGLDSTYAQLRQVLELAAQFSELKLGHPRTPREVLDQVLRDFNEAAQQSPRPERPCHAAIVAPPSRTWTNNLKLCRFMLEITDPAKLEELKGLIAGTYNQLLQSAFAKAVEERAQLVEAPADGVTH